MSTFHVQPRIASEIPEPPIAKRLFADTRLAGGWLVVRLYVAYYWLTAGLDKLTGRDFSFDALTAGTWGAYNAKLQWVFTGGHDGVGLHGFIAGAISKANPASGHPDVQGWYASFLQAAILPNTGWMAYVITLGEVAIGLGLLVGALSGIAAFFGLFMNFNFLLAGTVSINPVLAIATIFLVLAWRIAGYYGLDRYLLPALGTPWTGALVNQEHIPAGTAATKVTSSFRTPASV